MVPESTRRKAHIVRERRASVDSNSTITSLERPAEQPPVFADFDDTVSVDDSNFQGDDEESVADSYIDDESVQVGISHIKDRAKQEGDSTALSRRAEEILANAKQRLTRSSSALGAAGGYRPPSTASRDVTPGSDSPKQSPRERASYGSMNSARNSLSPHVRDSMLEPLSEDETANGMDSSRPISLQSSNLETFLNPTFGSYNKSGLKRSASTAQMRDIKEQMNELKGRLSTLRDQARADTMKRRSLQSLRTPSPFTHAQVDQWYAAPKKASDISPVHEDSAEQPSIGNTSGSEDDARNETPNHDDIGDSSSESQYTEVNEEAPQTELHPARSRAPSHQENSWNALHGDGQEDADEDMKTEDGFQDDETSSYLDTASESGESSYHDSVQNQVSHEDREDAFDYEHFFLHSAMGSMSQRKLGRDSDDDYSSDDSTETTVGPAAANRRRRGSTVSTSTMESFATATEGRNTRAEDEAAREHRAKARVDHEAVKEQHRARVAAPAEIPMRVRSQTPIRAKRPAFEGADPIGPRSRSSAATFPHHPSISSLDSFGTSRSFPLVNRPKSNNNDNSGLLTPRDSPDQSLKRISETLLSDATSSIYGDKDKDNNAENHQPGHGDLSTPMSMSSSASASTIEMLQRDDQILVERLVGSLGRCILGLAESGRATPESRMYRRKIEAAKRALENFDADGDDSPTQRALEKLEGLSP
ncbi:hypothetical protein SLS62_000666 [Diatrype stigma]|uniref:Uncharacterized protein n=1 Tax=Diatrype stigma TaxID=117547 RepID=A0AAN9UX08_9PEZI